MVRLSAAARVLILSSLAALGIPGVSAGQTPATLEWKLQNLRARWCVYYLMDSASADKELPRGYQPRSAGSFPSLHPAVARLIQDDPTYRSWVPAQLCTSHYDHATVDGESVGDSTTSVENAQVLASWLIGTSVASDGDSTRPTFYIETIRSSNWRLLRQGEIWLLRGDRATTEVGKVPESTEDLYQVRIGGTVITWEGHLAGDSAWSAPAVNEDWYTQSSRNARIHALVSFTPENAQNVAGTLRIVGKDDLAKSLRNSPVRMVGPMMWGGGASITFSR